MVSFTAYEYIFATRNYNWVKSKPIAGLTAWYRTCNMIHKENIDSLLYLFKSILQRDVVLENSNVSIIYTISQTF